MNLHSALYSVSKGAQQAADIAHRLRRRVGGAGLASGTGVLENADAVVDVGIVGTAIYYYCYYYFIKRLRKHGSDSLLNSWAIVIIITNLFLDFAAVTYYSFIPNLLLCLCFYAAENARPKIKRTINTNNNEKSRHYPPLQY